MTRSRRYVAEHQKDWETFVQPLTYTCNTKVHRSTNAMLFSLVLRKHPREPTLFSTKQARHTNVSGDTSVQATQKALEVCIQALRSRLDRYMLASRQRYKRDCDKLVRVTFTFTPGDMVFADRQPLFAATTHLANVTANAM